MDITKFAITRTRVTAVAFLVIAVMGLQSYANMPRSEDPGFTVRTALVTTVFPGASPERLEQLVTDKLEKVIQEIPEIDFIASQSKTGLSLIFVNVNESYTEMQPIWDKLRRKLDTARDQLPGGVIGPDLDDEFGDVFGTIVTITGDDFAYAYLKEVADEVRDELLLIEEVAKVEIHGAQEERIFIEYNNARLSEIGLSPGQLQQILSARNITLPGGDIRTADEQIVLEPSGNFESLEDLRRTVINLPGSSDVVFLEDVAEIFRGYVDPPRGMMRSSGSRSLGLAISLREGGNILILGDQVRATIERVQGLYPIGIEFDFIQFQANDVSRLIDDFVGNLLQAIAVVTLVMLVSLGLRTGMVVASLIPMTVLTALVVMSAVGIGLNQLSIASLIIALGMLVDNAIVMSESIMVQMREGKPPAEAALSSAHELRIPLLTSSLTTCAAFLPIYLAESMTGEYVADLFWVVSITLLCSWVIALTLIPVLCVKFLRVEPRVTGDESAEGADGGSDKVTGSGSAQSADGGSAKGTDDGSAEVVEEDSGGSYNTAFYRRYRAALLLGLQNPWFSLAGVVLIFIAGMNLFRWVPNIFFPPNSRPTLTADLTLPAGTPIERTEAMVIEFDRFIRDNLVADEGRTEGVVNWASFIGEGSPRFLLSITPEKPRPEYAMLLVNATSRPQVDVLVEELEAFANAGFPDLKAVIMPLPLGPPAWPPIEVRISGRDTEVLFDIVDQVKEHLREMPGTKNIDDNWGTRTKKLFVDVDQPRALRAGVSSQDIAISLQAYLTGIDTTEFREGDEIIPITLRSVARQRDNLDRLESLNVYSQSTGTSVPLLQVADVRIEWQPALIVRRDRLRTVTVEAGLEPGVTAASINAQLVPWLDEISTEWGLGYKWELGGETETSDKSNASIIAKLPIALMIIVLLLVSQFNSIRRPLIILMTIPLALVGVAIGLVIADSYFGFMTFMGVISLAGIVINNAIVLIDRINIEIEDNGLPPARAVVESAQRRLRPILLTTATTAGGLLPLYLGGGPMWEPMAVAIMSGLVFATVLTLGLVPILYSLFFRISFKGFCY